MASEKFANVWDALADTPEQAANLRARAELMRAIAAVIKRQGWMQAEGRPAGRNHSAAHQRTNELMTGRISKFSLNALLQIATALGLPGVVSENGSQSTLSPKGSTEAA